MLEVMYFTCITISTPRSLAKSMVEIIFKKSREFPGSREIKKKISDFRDWHLGPGLESLGRSLLPHVF